MVRSGSLEFGDIHPFNTFPRPRGFPEEDKARFDAGVVQKTADRQPPTQFSPSMTFHQPGDDRFQGNAVQRVTGMGSG